ncbi:MAG: hypothetical protein KAG43_07505 [Candidatus Marithrix sp.]|nr:hypothetical protein [Candidatus Marithrix sp.]
MRNIFVFLSRITPTYLLLLGVGMVFAEQAQAKPQLLIEQSIVGDITAMQVNETFIYKLKYRCASTTENCEKAKIINTLSPSLYKVAMTGSPHIKTYRYSGSKREATWYFNDMLPAGSTGEITLEVKFPKGTTINGTTAVNQATMQADNADIAISNTTTVTAIVNNLVSLEKIIYGTNHKLDNEVKYKIALCNASDSPNLQNITVIDQLLPNTTFISATQNGSYNSETQTVVWPQVDLLRSGSCFTSYIVVIYPSSDFTMGDITNTVTTTATPLGDVEQTYTASVITPFAAGLDTNTTKISIYKSGPKEVILGSIINYGFNVKNIGNTSLTNMVIRDTIPPQLEITTLRTGSNNQEAFPVTIDYQTNLMAEWQSIGSLATPQSVDITSLGLSNGEYINQLRWQLGTLPVGFRSTSGDRLELAGFSANILPISRDGNPIAVGTEIVNVANYMYQERSREGSMSRRTTIIQGTAGPKISKYVYPSTAMPGAKVKFTISLSNKEITPLVNPTIIDLLDSNLEYVSWELYKNPGNGPQPIFNKVDDYQGTGKTLLTWSWTGDAAYSLPLYSKSGDPYFSIRLMTTVKSMAAAGNITNQASVIAENPVENIKLNRCYETVIDVYDFDNDTDTTELLCASKKPAVTVASVAAMDSKKWVKGQLDSEYHRYPNWGKTARAGTLQYRLNIKNIGNIPMKNIVVVDILPFIGDAGVIDLSQRESGWRPQLIGAVDAGVGIVVSYSIEENPCRTEVSEVNDCKAANWTTILPEDITTVRSLQFNFGDKVVDAGDELKLTWPMYAPANAQVNTIAWNSFGYVATRTDTNSQLLPSEPIKVGIEVLDIEPAIYGDRVWLDDNGDGLQDENELGLNGVRVELYQPGIDNLPNTQDDVFIDFTLTANGSDEQPGYYIFSHLKEGNYFAKFVPPVGYKLSPQDRGEDNNLDSDVEINTKTTEITYLYQDTRDETWDMGLVKQGTAALGNYVWFDRNQDGLQNESADNGLNGILVELYHHPDGATDITGDAPIKSTITSNNTDGNPGYYLFEELDAGQYSIRFSLPDNEATFTGNTGSSDLTDSDANTYGFTDIITLNSGNFDRSWDAGIVLSIGQLSLGNRVWLDANKDGLYDANTEQGINDVKVNLYLDTDGNGFYSQGIDAEIASMKTITKKYVDGYYLFEGLKAGKYIVQIDPSNFTPGKPLDGLVSSTGASDASNIDHDDNGHARTAKGVLTTAMALANPIGATDELDYSNLTIDFGLHKFEIQECNIIKMYGVHDAGLNNTQFFTVDSDLVVDSLGPVYPGHDIETLDIHPTTGLMYAASGDDPDDGIPNGTLYQVDKQTGAINMIGATGFGEVSGISFRPSDSVLWAWADREGLLTIDLATGQGTMITESKLAIEALTWDSAGEVLYATENNNLWTWNSNSGVVELACEDLNMPGQTEALDMYSNNVLLFGLNERSDLKIHAWDVNNIQACQNIMEVKVETPSYNDIEGITWELECK